MTSIRNIRKIYVQLNTLRFTSTLYFNTCSKSKLFLGNKFTHLTNRNFDQRQFWSWLNVIWNKFDKDRVKEAGPDQAAAEWLLRCGAIVKFKDHPDWDSDYNAVTNSSNPLPKIIEAIDTNESCVDADGFEYLKGLKSLKKITLRFSPYVTDACLKKIAEYSGQTLEELTIEDCYEISEWGLLNHLPLLKHLRFLKLKNLPYIKDSPSVLKSKLAEILPPKCEITVK